MSIGKLVAIVLGLPLLSLFLIVGCQGDDGPPGPSGLSGDDGPPGDNLTIPVPDSRVFGLMVANGTASDLNKTLKVNFSTDPTAVPSSTQVVARRLATPPILDGVDGGSAEWGAAIASNIAFTTINGNDNGISSASVKAGYDDNYIYMSISWTEVASGNFAVGPDTTKNKWSFQFYHSVWSQAGGEDKLMVVWELNDIAGWENEGAGAILEGAAFQTKSAGEMADLWVWQSTETYYASHFADKFVEFSDVDGERWDVGTGFVVENTGNPAPRFMRSGSSADGSFYPLWSYEYARFDTGKTWIDGAEIPGYVFYLPSLSVADVPSYTRYNNGT